MKVADVNGITENYRTVAFDNVVCVYRTTSDNF